MVIENKQACEAQNPQYAARNSHQVTNLRMKQGNWIPALNLLEIQQIPISGGVGERFPLKGSGQFLGGALDQLRPSYDPIFLAFFHPPSTHQFPVVCALGQPLTQGTSTPKNSEPMTMKEAAKRLHTVILPRDQKLWAIHPSTEHMLKLGPQPQGPWAYLTHRPPASKAACQVDRHWQCDQIVIQGTSLVVQCSRIHFPMQGMWFNPWSRN